MTDFRSPGPEFPRSLVFSTSEQHTLSIAILGTDAVLAARPASAIQLAHAVLRVGYDAVYPATWGDELVAAGCLQRLAERNGGSVVLCACPLVAQRLLRHGNDIAPLLLPLVSPPVAVARYLRALHAGRPLHITYMGSCPEGAAAEIDARLSPAEVEAELRSRGIVATRQPQYFESVLPPDRRRFYSLPGGAPAPNWLKSGSSARTLVTLSGDDLPAELAQTLLAGDPALVDVAPVLGCVCSGAVEHVAPGVAREQATKGEPPRSPSPIIDVSLPIELDRTLPAAAEPPPPADESSDIDAQVELALEAGEPDAGEDVRSGAPEPASEAADGHGSGSPSRSDDEGELLHRYSRPTPRFDAQAPRAPSRTPIRTPPFVAPIPPASAGPGRDTDSSGGHTESSGGSGGSSGERATSPPPAAGTGADLALAIDVLERVKLIPDSEASHRDDGSTPAATPSAERVPAQAQARRTTPVSLRRIAAAAPVVRTGAGRSVPRAYAAHRRGPVPLADSAPEERETTIQRSVEPLTVPPDFRPPIPPRAPLPPRPATLVPHQTISAPPHRRAHFSPPPRRRSRAGGVLIVIAIAAVGALSLLAVRHLTARDQAHVDAASVVESSGSVQTGAMPRIGDGEAESSGGGGALPAGDALPVDPAPASDPLEAPERKL